MKKKLNILFPPAKIIFVGWFVVWTLSAFLIVQKASQEFSLQEEPYLLTSQVSSSYLYSIEESKKPRYSGENESRFFYTLKYLSAYSINCLKPSGNYHYIRPDGIPVISEVSFSTDHPRPPPSNI